MAKLSFCEHLGAALQAERKRAAVRPAEVAHLLDRDTTTIWRWETGKNWPENPDQVVDVYSGLDGSRPLELWRDAIRRAAKAEKDLARSLGPGEGDESSVDGDLTLAESASAEASEDPQRRRRGKAAGSGG